MAMGLAEEKARSVVDGLGQNKGVCHFLKTRCRFFALSLNNATAFAQTH